MSRALYLAFAGSYLVFGCAGAGTGAGRAAGARAGEPLDCMRRFRLREFAIGSWAFKKDGDFGESYLPYYKGMGFNLIIHCLVNSEKKPPKDDFFGPALGDADRVGMNVILHTAKAYGPWGAWEDASEFTGPYATVGGYARLPDLKWLHKKYGDHVSLVGYLIGDDMAVGPFEAECAKWLRENAPDMLPVVGQNLSPEVQAKSHMPVLIKQNYAWSDESDKKEDEATKRARYCEALDADRRFANEHDMTFWPVFSASESDSRLRFQAMAPVAYGAQGVLWFAVTDREPWQPGGRLHAAAKYCNEYLSNVAGPRVIGCRSIAIYDTSGRKGCEAPGAGKHIEKMDADLAAGLLAQETDFRAGRTTPAYVMVVDCRTVGPDAEEPAERTVHIKFGMAAKSVEVFGRELIEDEGGKPKTVPGAEVELKLKAGDGVLLKPNY